MPTPRSSRVAGVTLLELTIAVAVAATLAAIAIPQLRAAREAANSGAAHQALVGSLAAASAHAANAGVEVVMCPGRPQGCWSTHDWTNGWIVFVDPDRDRVPAPHEALLKQALPLQGNARLHSTTGRTRLVFQPNGGAPGSNVTFTLCDGRGPERAVSLVMNNTGQLRKGSPDPSAARACALPR